LLEEAQARGLLEFGRDEKSGAYVYRSSAVASDVGNLAGSAGESAQRDVVSPAASGDEPAPEPGLVNQAEAPPQADANGTRSDGRRKSRGGRKSGAKKGAAESAAPDTAVDAEARAIFAGENEDMKSAGPISEPGSPSPEPLVLQAAATAGDPAAVEAAAKPARGKRGTGKSARATGEDGERSGRRRVAKVAVGEAGEGSTPSSEPMVVAEVSVPAPEVSEQSPERKSPPRSRRPRKTATPKQEG
ncbi:MAG: hypothetical protein JNK52_05170, partial [Zoogloeaceae bacterium]|nr:hypothetical protein [Zoogloeaceae bacterium]